MTGSGGVRSALETAVDQFNARLRPGSEPDAAVEVLAEFGLVPGSQDEILLWFTLQDGTAPDSPPLGRFRPESLDDLADGHRDWRDMIAELEEDFARDGEDVRALDHWPDDGWFPLQWGDEPVFVDTRHSEAPGRVIRWFGREMEVVAGSIAEFLVGLVDDDAKEAGRPSG